VDQGGDVAEVLQARDGERLTKDQASIRGKTEFCEDESLFEELGDKPHLMYWSRYVSRRLNVLDANSLAAISNQIEILS
jgi:hypothetical protein